MNIVIREFNGTYHLGDCFRYSSEGKDYYLLVTQTLAQHGFITFTPVDLKNSGLPDIKDRLKEATLTYYTRKPSKSDKIIKLLNGKLPLGYFGFSVHPKDLYLIKDLLMYLASINLNLIFLSIYGGTSWLPDYPLKEVIEYCYNPFAYKTNKPVLDDELTMKIPLNTLCS